MTDELNIQWLQIEEAKARFLAYLENWDKDRLQASPDSCWSALQIVEHLITSETGTLEYLKKKTQTAPELMHPAGQAEAQAARKLSLALKSDERWKAPDILPQPSGNFPMSMLQAAWSDLRVQWKAFLDELPADYYDKQVFKHPLAGRLNMEQTLDFVCHHIDHHVHQLRRLAQKV